MDSKLDDEIHDDRPSSPIRILQHFSEEAFRVAGEALNSVYSGGASSPTTVSAHRRTRSEVSPAMHRRTDNIQRLKNHLQRAWQWGNHSREETCPLPFNPEVLANQKRQWYQLHSRTTDQIKYKEPTFLFEHFVIAGLHPDTNLGAVEEAFAQRKQWEMEMNSHVADFKPMKQQGPSIPTLEPQILFRYPPGKRLAIRMKDLSSFCFPAGVKARVLARTPSLSELNEVVYGQEHLGADASSFIFSLKVADNATLYGVCVHVTEIVQRPPAGLGISSPLSHSSGGCSRFLISAPRCYCVLTRVPFFKLHYELLNSIIAQERLSKITQFVNDVTLSGYGPSVSKLDDQLSINTDTSEREFFSDWMASAIPIGSASAITAAAAGIISEDEIPHFSPKAWPHSPESVANSDASDREVEKDSLKSIDSRKSLQYHEDCAPESPEIHPFSSERTCGACESDLTSPAWSSLSSRSRMLEHFASSESLFSPARGMVCEDDDDDELFANHQREYADDEVMEWARENKNDLLQILCTCHSQPLPSRGNVLVFQPLDYLQAIEYRRPSVSALGFPEGHSDESAAPEVNLRLAVVEEALALSIWTTATVCRVLSLESVLTMIAGVLLEKQIVVVCPNLGVLSAIVLSLVPMIRPFQWQSLLLPILPGKMFEFLDAPVPFIAGIQHKPVDLKFKTTSNLILVNMQTNQVKKCPMPTLPRHKELVSELSPIHARLARESTNAKKHPVYKCSQMQAEAATQFLDVMRRYLESLCSELRSHTITSVQSNNDRVSLLLKDSFIDSFATRDRAFIKPFIDTQLFSVLSDSRLSIFENGYS